MFNRYFVFALINTHKQYLLALACLFLIVSQNVHSQQQIAQDAYAIFQQSCLICHGPDGAYRETLLMEHSALIANGTVVAGNPNASELYKRLLTTDLAKRMPLGQPQLSVQAINTIRNWILAGAPDWTAPVTTSGQFISPSEVLNSIETHLMSLTPFDRAFARYFTMTHLYNAGESADILQEYHKGLSKLINSLSWGSAVTNPQPIDAQGTIFYIDLRHYEWDRNDGWGQIETAYPYHISFDAPAQTALKGQMGRLQTQMKCEVPAVHVDWFIATASAPLLYHNLLSLPLTDRELETRLEVDVASNLQNAPGVRVWRAGTNKSGVSNNNRVIERHTSRYGAYWKSYDFAGSVGTQNIFTHPLSFTHDGGEVIFNLPNGLQGYYVTNATGFRLDAAPINIVSNPAASDPRVRNGISCFGCHTEGMKTFEDQVRSVIESNTTPAYDKEQTLRLYVEQSKMDTLLQEDTEMYRGALEATGGAVGDIEPIARFHEAFQDEVDAAYAAAVVGLETEAFLAKIRENIGLQNAGLLVLDSPNGSMKRDAWTSNFPAIIYALDFPDEQVDSPSQPEQPPGTVVRIPDTNLRAVIAEALGKRSNAPITVKEMEGLGRLEVQGREIRDLTGIQFAINLNRLNVRNNPIFDISPIAGLINLRVLELDNDNPIPLSDLSALRGLVKLEYLNFSYDNVSDLSALRGLVNLKYLHFTDSNVFDLSPLAGLVKLESLGFSRSNVSDISPLAGLVNLKFIGAWGHSISDLSPLAGLTKLEEIDFCGGDISDLTPLAGLPNLTALYLAGEDISDISPLARLTGLTRLSLQDNDISDLSPLAVLTNLKWLNIAENEISNLSPLDELRENIKLVWYDNPAYPKGGAKIEGPWLWTIVPTAGMFAHRAAASGIDFLAEASGGEVTELNVATGGAREGAPVGDSLWIADTISTASNNINTMANATGLGTGDIDFYVAYGSLTLNVPREQDTLMFVGADDAVNIWLNGQLVYNNPQKRSANDYQDFFPVTLRQGINILLVAVYDHAGDWHGFFGFTPDAEYTVANTGVEYTITPATIHRGETFTLDIDARNVSNLMGWQFDVVFDSNILEAVDVSEGDFLKTGAATFFQGGSIDNSSGQITGLTAARLSTQGVSGTGTLLKVRFKAKVSGESDVTLRNLQFVSLGGDTIDATAHGIRITVEGGLAMGDVNRDGVVTIVDLVIVAQQLNQRVSADAPADVNGDGVVNIVDMIIVSQAITPQAPAGTTDSIDAAMIEAWIAQARLEDDGSLAFKQGIENLQALLRSLIPKETALFRNYPNPFNPETWVPYHLAEPADVTLTIYDTNGAVVRRFDLGYQRAGYYTNRSKAVYWDGRNATGESVASGTYFYHLRAGEHSQTRRLVILK